MRRFLSALWQSVKNKPEVGRKRRRARGESRRFASRRAHEESRLSRSANGRFCYNRWAERGELLHCRAVTASLAGSVSALLVKPGKLREEMRRRCTAQLSTTIQNIRGCGSTR